MAVAMAWVLGADDQVDHRPLNAFQVVVDGALWPVAGTGVLPGLATGIAPRQKTFAHGAAFFACLLLHLICTCPSCHGRVPIIPLPFQLHPTRSKNRIIASEITHYPGDTTAHMYNVLMMAIGSNRTV